MSPRMSEKQKVIQQSPKFTDHLVKGIYCSLGKKFTYACQTGFSTLLRLYLKALSVDEKGKVRQYLMLLSGQV